jgi:TfoX/Sxy family transcriptional regulator of competence genes
MEFRKSSEDLVNLFYAALPDDPRVTRRKTFGSPCAYVGGNMVAGIHNDDIFVRLAEPEIDELLAQPAARRFDPMGGRPMRSYVVIPAAMVNNPDSLASWIAKAIVHGFTMPEKTGAGGRTHPRKVQKSESRVKKRSD